uniref:Ig-like domain-containing protein n=1 Tax=Timema douglasi TaxID=61478 RepID=A0A7R8VTM6_TIMDO|nr:unnamed protein product [Timema douglasi]
MCGGESLQYVVFADIIKVSPCQCMKCVEVEVCSKLCLWISSKFVRAGVRNVWRWKPAVSCVCGHHQSLSVPVYETCGGGSLHTETDPATTLPPDKSGSSLRWLKSLQNVTKEAGESVKLRCEVTGDPAPTKLRWFKNEAPVDQEPGRLSVRRYTPQVDHCVLDRIRTVARGYMPQVDHGVLDRTRIVGVQATGRQTSVLDRIRFVGVQATGRQTSVLDRIRVVGVQATGRQTICVEPCQGRSQECPRYFQGQEGVLGSRLRINFLDTHDTGFYKCEASNGAHKTESTAVLMVKMSRWGEPTILDPLRELQGLWRKTLSSLSQLTVAKSPRSQLFRELVCWGKKELLATSTNQR